MSIVFADTSLFVAFLSRRDQHHAEAALWVSDFEGRIVTTQWVLAEVANFFGASNARSAAATLLRSIAADFRFSIAPATSADFEAGVQLYEQRPDQEWSLIDCISFHVMRRENITEALTADHHFEQAGFAVLLKAS